MIFKYFKAECDFCGKVWSSEGMPISTKKEAKRAITTHGSWVMKGMGFCFCGYKCEKDFHKRMKNQEDASCDDYYLYSCPQRKGPRGRSASQGRSGASYGHRG